MNRAQFILFGLAVQTLASWVPILYAEPTFLPLTEVSRLSHEMQKDVAVMNKAIFSADFNSMNCTGTYISHEGHFLTADHCIQACFDLGTDWQDYLDFKIYEDPQTISDSGGYTHPEYFVFKRFRVEKIRDKYLCDVKVNGEIKKARLIATGKGRLFPYFPDEFKSDVLKKQYRALQDSGVWAASDFAVLQLIDKPRTACLPLGNRNPFPGEKLRTISYTCIATPSRPQNQDGAVALYTEGILATRDFFTGNSKDMLTNGSTPPNTYWSNLDAETCSSGSAVIGADGKILGVFNMLFYGSKKFGPSTNLIRVSGMAEIQSALSSQGQFINCD